MHKVVVVEHASSEEAARKAEETANRLAAEGWELVSATSAYLQKKQPLDAQQWNAQNTVAHTLFFRR